MESKDLQNAVHFFTKYLGDIIVPNTDLMGFTNNLLKNNSFLKPSIIELLQKADFKISDVSIENVKIPVTEELRSLVPNKFKEIFEENVVRGANEIEALQLMFKHTVEGHTYNLPFDMESEGTKRYYEFSGILSSLIHSPAGLMIDEIESSLHPDLLKHIYNRLKSNLATAIKNAEKIGEFNKENEEMSVAEMYKLFHFLNIEL